MAWTLWKDIKYALAGIPGENLTDFPKLLKITTDADIAAELGSGGGIKVTSPDGLTDYAIGLYPATSLAAGTILARVKIPSLLTAANVGDVIGRLYYSASETTTQNRAGVASSYKIFMPNEEDPSGSAPQMRDWVSDTLIGTSGGTMLSGDLIAGQVGNGLDFDGTDDYVLTTYNVATGTGEISISLIASTSSAATTDNAMITFGPAGAGAKLMFGIENGVLWARCNSGNTASAGSGYADGTKRHLAITKPSSVTTAGLVFYANGTALSKSAAGAATLNLSGAVNLARNNDGSGWFFAGLLDEVRIRDVQSSANWIDYEYTDDFDNANTFTLSAEQGGSAPSFRSNWIPRPRLVGGGIL